MRYLAKKIMDKNLEQVVAPDFYSKDFQRYSEELPTYQRDCKNLFEMLPGSTLDDSSLSYLRKVREFLESSTKDYKRISFQIEQRAEIIGTVLAGISQVENEDVEETREGFSLATNEKLIVLLSKIDQLGNLYFNAIGVLETALKTLTGILSRKKEAIAGSDASVE
ncbi:MAG: hypothetical protein HOL16_02600 [Alphaproteobacteria bacterium]|jgi:hypothetical protein|nr:hypothetical protein [Alphaproteobacteria bacterium]